MQAAPGTTGDADAKVNEFARIMFLHRIAAGYQIDVTKDSADLGDSVAEAEKNGWIANRCTESLL